MNHYSPGYNFLLFLSESVLSRPISVREFIRVKIAIETVPKNTTFEEIKLQIIPLIARSELEQNLINESFEHYFKLYQTKRGKSNIDFLIKSNKSESRISTVRDGKSTNSTHAKISKKIFEFDIKDYSSYFVYLLILLSVSVIIFLLIY